MARLQICPKICVEQLSNTALSICTEDGFIQCWLLKRAKKVATLKEGNCACNVTWGSYAWRHNVLFRHTNRSSYSLSFTSEWNVDWREMAVDFGRRSIVASQSQLTILRAPLFLIDIYSSVYVLCPYNYFLSDSTSNESIHGRSSI